jgi:simple sugar transport system permease protein
LDAYLFGAVSAIGLILQGLAVDISPYLLSSLPYLATILVLLIISRDAKSIQLRVRASLGQPLEPND